MAFTTLAKKKARIYSAAVSLGLLSQIAGYAGRYACINDQTSRDGFYSQIIFLTIGPAFLAAAIYWETRAIVLYFGKKFSIVPPEAYLIVSCNICKRVRGL